MYKARNRNIFYLLTIIVIIVGVANFNTLRFDLTAEKRFTLSDATIGLLQRVKQPIKITVFLTGNLPADYKKLATATENLLSDFKRYNQQNIQFEFKYPSNNLNDSLQYKLYDSLAKMGVVFERNEQLDDANNKQPFIIPCAIVESKTAQPLVVDLRSSKKVFKAYNVVTDIPEEDIEATRNAAESLLEYKFINAIDKLTREYVPTVAYLVGNGQPINLTVNDMGESLRNQYRLGIFNLQSNYPKASEIDALLIVKPTIPFSDEDKLKIDQYLMQGGKIVWCIDKLYAEMDSLQRSQADLIAYDRGLNIDDQLFKYGVRINNNLLQDLNCAKVPIVTGYNPDNSPKIQRMPWPYYPFATSANANAITKNIDRVLTIFPSGIDTIAVANVKKTVLLATDTNSKIISTPALITLNTIKSEDDFLQFNKSHIPIAVLLEGMFSSLYANRLSKVVMDSVEKRTGIPFASTSSNNAKQIVISDADIITNSVSNTTGPMQMGMLPLENYKFANKDFFLNSMDYLVSNSAIFNTRNKQFTLRILDKEKIASQQLFWQLLNIILPIAFVILLGATLIWLRKKKYTSIN